MIAQRVSNRNRHRISRNPLKLHKMLEIYFANLLFSILLSKPLFQPQRQHVQLLPPLPRRLPQQNQVCNHFYDFTFYADTYQKLLKNQYLNIITFIF